MKTIREAKRTAGRLHLDDDLEPLYLFGEDMEMVAEVRGWGARLPQTENAKHLVACWNAFEAGGAVALAREALRALILKHQLCNRFDAVEKMDKETVEAKRALAALDAVEGK